MNSNLYLLYIFFRCISAWLPTPDPRRHYQYSELDSQIGRFSGNDSYTNFFKLLEMDSDSILIGSRNIVFNISLYNLTENVNQRISWQPTGAHRELCYLKGKSEEACQNYIRVGAKVDEDHILICGTNAYKPLCRNYKFYENKIDVIKESEGQGWCPYDPNHNSTALYTDGHIYSATVADFGGVEALIYREPLRTERSDLKQLNDASFVSSMAYDDYVLFFFREAAVEYINCGKVVYSRVARVCKKDKGGPHLFGDRWTSFVKARLNCSIPGDYPFYFDEIQSMSEIVDGVYDSAPAKMVYGVFNTPTNAIGGSAICAFSMDSIMKTFDGAFKEQESMNANWLRVPPSKVPEPRPGQCVNDSRTLPDKAVNFVKTHTLMDEAVPSFKQPQLVRISPRNRFLAITVDPQVKTLDGATMDVLFIGTDDGKVIKAVNRGASGSIFIEELQVNNKHAPIKTLSVSRSSSTTPKLVIITDNSVETIPVNRCSKIQTCRECVSIQDPYCAWDTITRGCVVHSEVSSNKHNLVQNVFRGTHPACQPPGHIPPPIVAQPFEKDIMSIDIKEESLCPKCSECINNPCSSGDSSYGQEKIVIYTADTLGMVVTTSVIATLVIGFVAGYFCSRHFRPDNAYTNMPLHSPHSSALNGEGASYLSPCANNKSINLLVNVPPKNTIDKNANTSADNNKTLQKVKKTYI